MGEGHWNNKIDKISKYVNNGRVEEGFCKDKNDKMNEKVSKMK